MSMQTNDPIQDALLDPKYTDYQREMARAYRIHPRYCPAEEPPMPETNVGGFKRQAPAPITQAAPTPEEQARYIAGVYGVGVQYVPTEQFEAEAAAERQAALDERRLARRAEIAKKYRVSDQHLHHIPLEWFDA